MAKANILVHQRQKRYREWKQKNLIIVCIFLSNENHFNNNENNNEHKVKYKLCWFYRNIESNGCFVFIC